MNACCGFPPMCAPDARVMILGSMPSAASLLAGEYYAHPRNAFWRIQCALWGEPFSPDMPYARKLDMLRVHRVALWDAAESCRREGSLDSAMREVVCNDFGALFAGAPGIRRVFCNGGAAHALYLRAAHPRFAGIPVQRLPSTSPAHTLAFERKLAAWQAVREAVLL